MGHTQARHPVGAGVKYARWSGGAFGPVAQVARPALVTDGSDPSLACGPKA
jgi:hypothetical protein